MIFSLLLSQTSHFFEDKYISLVLCLKYIQIKFKNKKTRKSYIQSELSSLSSTAIYQINRRQYPIELIDHELLLY